MVRQRPMPAAESSGRGGARVSPPGGGLGRRGRPEAAAQICIAGLSFLAAGGAAAETVGPPPPPETWAAAEVEAGRAECGKRFSGLHVLFEALGPVKEGVCGSPAPLRLMGFEYGAERALMFEPAPVVSCKLAAALHRWAAEVVQPEAQAHLHTRIVGMTTVSSYNCRSRYGDSNQRISEHALANALDISEFVPEKGERIALLESWSAGDERSAFLRAIHAGACKIFGTALGPEANEAHKNHFHFDMKERRQPLCDFTPEQLKAKDEAKQKAPAPVPQEAPKR